MSYSWSLRKADEQRFYRILVLIEEGFANPYNPIPDGMTIEEAKSDKYFIVTISQKLYELIEKWEPSFIRRLGNLGHFIDYENLYDD